MAKKQQLATLLIAKKQKTKQMATLLMAKKLNNKQQQQQISKQETNFSSLYTMYLHKYTYTYVSPR